MIIEFWKTNENAITCYKSKPFIYKGAITPLRSIAKKKYFPKTPVIVEKPSGKKEEYESMRQAACAMEVTPQKLYDFLNGKGPNPTEYKIYKSTLNN